MRGEIVIRLSRRWVFAAAALVIVGVGTLVVGESLRAQDVQEKYSHKFDIVEKSGHLAIATSTDGQYVFVVGKNGVLISNNYGQMGSWSQTVKLK